MNDDLLIPLPPKPTRRAFAKSLALLAATPVMTVAQEPKPAKAETTTAAQALTEVVRLRYGQFVSDEHLEEIKRSIDRGQHGADRLKQFKLANGDEPAFVFSPEVQ
jgi:hypothetical protein